MPHTAPKAHTHLQVQRLPQRTQIQMEITKTGKHPASYLLFLYKGGIVFSEQLVTSLQYAQVQLYSQALIRLQRSIVKKSRLLA